MTFSETSSPFLVTWTHSWWMTVYQFTRPSSLFQKVASYCLETHILKYDRPAHSLSKTKVKHLFWWWWKHPCFSSLFYIYTQLLWVGIFLNQKSWQNMSQKGKSQLKKWLYAKSTGLTDNLGVCHIHHLHQRLFCVGFCFRIRGNGHFLSWRLSDDCNAARCQQRAQTRLRW